MLQKNFSLVSETLVSETKSTESLRKVYGESIEFTATTFRESVTELSPVSFRPEGEIFSQQKLKISQSKTPSSIGMPMAEMTIY